MAASRTETSYNSAGYNNAAYNNNNAGYHDHIPPNELKPAVPPRPGQQQPQPPKQQPELPKPSELTATRPSPGSIPVPIHENLPSTVPSDLIPPAARWVPDSTLPQLIHPSTWSEVGRAGPWPFTTLLKYRLPSGVELSWEARKHRRQVEQDVVSDPGPAVRERRAALRNSWWHRMLRIHAFRWSWWAVLWFNVGSHAFVYAGICLFIPYFNDSLSVYEANTGWSSQVLGGGFWLAGCVFEFMAVFTANPASKWYQRPKPLLPRNRRKYDPFIYQDAYITNMSRPWTIRRFFDRMDLIIPTMRTIGVLLFLVAAISYSGSFTLTSDQRIGLVFVCGIVASVFLLFAGYLSLAECCHRWLPFQYPVRNSFGHLGWWTNVLTIFGSLALLAYYITLWVEPALLYQKQGPAYPYIVFACLFTISDWFQAVEQGELYRFELGPNANNRARINVAEQSGNPNTVPPAPYSADYPPPHPGQMV